MSYDTQMLTYSVFVPNDQLMNEIDNPELTKGYEINFVEQAVRSLARTLVESDMIEAHKEYSMERQGYLHTFSVRVSPPR